MKHDVRMHQHTSVRGVCVFIKTSNSKKKKNTHTYSRQSAKFRAECNANLHTERARAIPEYIIQLRFAGRDNELAFESSVYHLAPQPPLPR